MITLGFDPGRKTGWAIVEDGQLLDHGQVDHGERTQDADRAFAVAFTALNGAVPEVIAVEYPYIPKGAAGRAASAGSVYFRAGCLRGAAGSHWPNAIFWTPTATAWRSVIGFKAGKREEVEPRIWEWARATAIAHETRERFALEGPERGGKRAKLVDEANAIGVAIAADARFGKRL